MSYLTLRFSNNVKLIALISLNNIEAHAKKHFKAPHPDCFG